MAIRSVGILYCQSRIRFRVKANAVSEVGDTPHTSLAEKVPRKRVVLDINRDHGTLEEVWRTRLKDAVLCLEFARNHVAEVQREILQSTLPLPDVHSTYQAALRAERIALEEYGHVFRIFTAFVVDGKPPEKSDWPPPRAETWDDEESE